MKKTILTLALMAASFSVFAQGKVLFGNDSNHLVTLGTDINYLLPADRPAAGLAAPWGTTGVLPSGRQMTAGLYAGSTSGSEVLRTVVPIGNVFGDGRINNVSYILPAPLVGGVTTFFQIKVWETSYASYEAQHAAELLAPSLGVYSTLTPEFSGLPGAGVTYPLIVGAQFNWLSGVNAFRPLTASNIPEPSSLALVGLSAGVMLSFRRRNSATNN